MKTQLARILIPFSLIFYLILGQFTAMAVPPPTISSFTPASGPVGTIVTITGANFNTTGANNIVFFGATRAIVSFASATSITVTAPAGATDKSISVTDITTGLTGHSARPFIFTFAGGPGFDVNSFDTKVDFTTGSQPGNTAIGDLDGDGRPDLAITNQRDNTVSILRNTSANGTVLFAAKIDLTMGSQPGSIFLEDLDGDGKPDLIVTKTDSTVSILRNTSTNGSISFADKVDFATGGLSAAIGDLDGDGRPDLAIANKSSSTVSVLRNTSTQGIISFSDKVDFFVEHEGFYGITIRDLDGDGKLDIIGRNNSYKNSMVLVLRNTSTSGVISFAGIVGIRMYNYATDFSIGDLDGDGKPDLAVASNYDYSLSIFRNASTSGSVSFVDRIEAIKGYPFLVSIADLDGDGKSDLVINNTSIFRNTSMNGAISFADRVDYAEGTITNSTSIGDLDGDGKPDLVITAANWNTVWVFKNTIMPESLQTSITSFSPTSGVAGTTILIKGKNFTGATVVSFGGIAAASFTVVSDTSISATLASGTSGRVSVTTPKRTVTIAGFTFILPPPPSIASFAPASGAIGATVTIAGANFNTTRANNIVFFGATQAEVLTASATSLTVKVPTGTTCQPISVTDVTTGLTGCAAQPFITTFAGGIAFNANSFADKVNFVADANAQDISVADLDGDGKPDLVVTNNGSNTVSLFRNTGTNGTVSFAAKVDLLLGSTPYRVLISDLDGDGKPDIAVFSYGVFIFRNTSTNGVISFAQSFFFTINAGQYGSVSIVDVDGDGKPDLAGIYDDTLVVFRNTSIKGTFLFADKVVIAPMQFAARIFFNDLDGDGKPDLALSGDYDVYILRNTSAAGKISFADKISIPIGSYNIKFSIGDLDGDGKSDLAITGTNTVSIYKNISTSGTVLFAGKVDYYTGPSPWNISIGDLDGDSKPDLVVSHYDTNNPASNTFSVLRNNSTSNAISFADKFDYPSGPVPVYVSIGDLDGDGKPDLAFTNWKNNTVSVYRNTIMPLDSLTTITSFTPTSGFSGTVVTIKGTHFTRATAVSFGGTYASFYTVVSDTSITAIVASGTSGSVDVTTPWGTATLAGFTFIPPLSPPNILTFAPTSGIKGITVTITGAHFTGATAVSFGDTPAASFMVISDTLITATLASGTSGNVSVTTPNGMATLAGFIYIPPPPPIVVDFTPVSGPVGTIVTLTGMNFNPSPANNVVFFGATQAIVSAVSNTSVTVTVPVSATYQSVSVTDITTGLTGYAAQPFIVTFPGGPTFDEKSFALKTNFMDLPSPYLFSIGDLDGDGKPDLVATSYNYSPNLNRVSIFKNTGTSGTVSFTAEANYEMGHETDPMAVSMGDLDGDGKLDFVVANFLAGTISVFRNTTTNNEISFAEKIDYSGGTYPVNISIGDLDGDGKSDLVVVNEFSNTISILRNTSTGAAISFADKVVFKTGGSPGSVSIRDLDGDGKPDLAVVNSDSNTISVFRNISTNGIISLETKVDFATEMNSYSITIGDIDGDGKPDLAVSSEYKRVVSVFRNTSTINRISFASKVDYKTGTSPFGLTIGDLNGDGKLDLAAANSGSNTISVYKNMSTSGSISFADKFDYNISGLSLSICDMDGDGKPDITIVNSGSISVLLNTIMPFPSITTFIPTSGWIGTLVTIKGRNFTGATKVSFGGVAAASFTVVSDTLITATIASGTSGSVSITTPDGTATLAGFTFIVPSPTITSFFPTSGSVGTTVTITGTNFNQTPANNIVFFGATQAVVSAASATSLTITVPAGATYKPVSVTDITTGLTGYAAQPFMTTFNGGTAFNANSFAAKVDFTTGTNPTSVSISDLDGDGKPDLAVVNSKSNTVSLFRNTGASDSVSFAGKMNYSTGIMPTNISVGDLDGDGKPDLVVTSTGKISVFRNTSTHGAISFAARVDYATGSLPVSVAIGDMDGDGRPDLAVANSKSNTVSVFKNTSTSGTISFTDKMDYIAGVGPVCVSIGDLDGDGKPELAVASVVGIVSVFRNTSANGSISFIPDIYLTTETGLCGVSMGDLDDDGELDLVVINAVANKVSVYRNTSTNGAISFAAKVDYVTGTDPASVSISDLNGDGKPDLAVTNDGSNTVSVYRNTSTNGMVSFVDKVDYTTGTRPAIVSIGDLNEDGKPDLAVANYYSNTLSVIKNTIKLNQTITFGPIPVKTYGMTDFTLGATCSSSLPVFYTSSNSAVATILTGQVHIVGPGSCFIYADQAGDASYNAAPQVSQSLTVDAKVLTIKADSGQSKKTGAADPMLTYTITEGSLVTGDSLTGTLTRVPGETVGMYAIQIGTLTAGSNYMITFIPNTFRIVSGTGINNIVADKPSIYPNPTSGLVSIDISEGTVTISDVSGKVLLETNLKNYKAIDISNYPSGIYIFMLKTKVSVYEFKILKH